MFEFRIICEHIVILKLMTKSISDSERLFLEDGVDQGIRNDGRDLTDFRPIVIALDVISTANGSSRVKNDELDIIVAVKVCCSYSNQI